MWCAPHIASLTLPVSVWCDRAEAATEDRAIDRNRADSRRSIEFSLSFWLTELSWIAGLVLRVELSVAQCAFLHDHEEDSTSIRTWMVEVLMPPTMGAAIGFITSEPMPDSQKIGTRLARTAQIIINVGRKRWTAPSIAASSTSAFVNAFPDCNLCSSAS